MGRDADNTLPLPDDTTVSRRHARIEAVPEGTGFQIVDEGSSNGTYVNGQRIPAGNSRILVVGDEIQIGASRLRFEG
jgi:pSer/pThr/pTyr-binding forkhead associated (FHA) protein